jgi:plastocyanin
VSPKLTRLLLAASMAVGFSVAPMLAYAAGPGVDIVDDQFRYTDGSNSVTVYLGDDVTWRVAGDAEGTHTVTPYDTQAWTDKVTGSPKDLTAGKEFSAHFAKPGKYYYFCENHGGGTKEKREGMWGVVNVVDPNATTTTTTTAPPSTTPTTAPTTTTTPAVTPAPTTPTTAAPASPAGVKPPGTAVPAPTTTTKPDKDKKGKDDKKDETTTTTAPPPPPPVDLPDSAIIPALPGLDGSYSTAQNGIEAPDGTPAGDAIALLKSKKGGGNGKAVKLLIVSGVGLGALGIGTAGYKYANRSSKYFPA